MTEQDVIKSLLEQANNDFNVAQDLVKTKHYDYALFIGHLVLEKVLKALILKNGAKTYPPIHQLNKLANLANVELSSEQSLELDEITRFNVATRYDTIKRDFYYQANEEYANKWFQIIKNYKIWLEELF